MWFTSTLVLCNVLKKTMLQVLKLRVLEEFHDLQRACLYIYIVNRLQRPATGVLLVEDYIAHEEAWFFLKVKYNNERHFNFYSLLIGLLIIIKAMY